MAGSWIDSRSVLIVTKRARSAQKKSAEFYRPGHQVRLKSMGGFTRGEHAEVIGSGADRIRLRRADGAEVWVDPGRIGSGVDVGEARELAVAPGDWLLLQANASSRCRRFVNGERVQVKRVEGNSALELTDGRTLPPEYRSFTHGYAVTSHSSQGRTVDEVLVVASSASFPAVSQEQFHVSIPRGRERVHVFTDDAGTLRQRV
jgi:ATP-dependent exoDNAse (exonuclease V) alpha subunit